MFIFGDTKAYGYRYGDVMNDVHGSRTELRSLVGPFYPPAATELDNTYTNTTSRGELMQIGKRVAGYTPRDRYECSRSADNHLWFAQLSFETPTDFVVILFPEFRLDSARGLMIPRRRIAFYALVGDEQAIQDVAQAFDEAWGEHLKEKVAAEWKQKVERPNPISRWHMS